MNLATDDLTALGERVWGSFIGRCMHRFIRMEGFDRSLVLASQAFTALIPMLIVTAALAPAKGLELLGSSARSRAASSSSRRSRRRRGRARAERRGGAGLGRVALRSAGNVPDRFTDDVA